MQKCHVHFLHEYKFIDISTSQIFDWLSSALCVQHEDTDFKVLGTFLTDDHITNNFKQEYIEHPEHPIMGDDNVTSTAERRLSRTLTQRYDMHSLRALQELEVENILLQ